MRNKYVLVLACLTLGLIGCSKSADNTEATNAPVVQEQTVNAEAVAPAATVEQPVVPAEQLPAPSTLPTAGSQGVEAAPSIAVPATDVSAPAA